MKIERKQVFLKAGVPYLIEPKGGIDFYASFHFYYPMTAWDKKIAVSLNDMFGNTVSKVLTFEPENGYALLTFEDRDSIFDGHFNGRFGRIELLSVDADLNLDFSATEPELV